MRDKEEKENLKLNKILSEGLNLNDKFPVFRFPTFFDVWDEELIRTGREFIKAKVLVPPFENCVYHTEIKLDNGDNSKSKTQIFFEKDSHLALQHFLLFKGRWVLHPASVWVIEGQPHLCVADQEDIGRSLHKVIPPNNFTQKELVTCGQQLVDMYANFTMLLNSKYVEKVEIKLTSTQRIMNKSRERERKSLFTDYVDIRFKHSYLTPDGYVWDKSKGPVYRPHWRRGHLRHLSNGRIIPVAPCMVNWNGEVITPKDYVFEGEIK